jgi:nitroreductase
MDKEAMALLKARRSVKPDKLVEPGPSAAELETILTIASRVPDHKKLVPWRFIVFEGGARDRFGEVIAAACIAAEPETPSDVRLAMERGRLARAPLVIAVVSRVTERPGAPEWEQILSAGASCYNLCLAANALGYGTSWLTEWIAYDPSVRAALGLADNERIAGFVYVGTPSEAPADRDRPALADIVTRWSP